MQRYIHGKDWDAKLLEALVSERMKPAIIANCPKIQINQKQLQFRTPNGAKNMDENSRNPK